MFSTFYSISSRENLTEYVQLYVPLALKVARDLGLDLKSGDFEIDHIGIQATSSAEFDAIDKLLCTYTSVINKGVIHNRRNNLYQLNNSVVYDYLDLDIIETFEPKPDANIKKLKAGIEHVAFIPKNFDAFYKKCLDMHIPIDKFVDDGESKFLKTSLINMIELEFRDKSLVDLFVNKNIR